MPTFGNGIIRKFSNNTSEMKRLAARDFEDILQVFRYLLSSFDPLTALIVSVPFLFLRDCSPPTMMCLCSRCCIDSRSGMHLPSLGFTRNRRSTYLEKHSKSSHKSYGSFETLLAPPSKHWNYLERQQLANKKLLNTLKRTVSLQNRMGRGSKHSIWAHISFMRWGIIRQLSGFSAPPILSQLKLYVPLTFVIRI